MRVKEMADLAGTTTRAVRHYHRLGLLPVPPSAGGRRDYGVEHLARLLRIRWLADRGMSLSRVAQILAADEQGTDRDAVLRDLRAARKSVEERQRLLREQADRVDELIARVADGGGLSPLPTVLTHFYDDVAARMGDLEPSVRDRALKVLAGERRLMMALAARGMIPASASRFVAELDAAERDVCARQICAFAELEQTGEAGAAQLAQESWALALRHRGNSLAVLNDLPAGALGRPLWDLIGVLSTVSYPLRVHRVFTSELLDLMLADPDFAAAIHRSAGGRRLVL
ncbi:MerR family transcriptional regulator [Actinomyces qiguomingii]|uniref:MerR family transcriptional regulator n=1 Tax=Actinomyces qiguomingii TaxID=2057800 RepID=UPI000CA03A36|nr:MerR family transcriptional regulator [Actinomyces qiguomingii]